VGVIDSESEIPLAVEFQILSFTILFDMQLVRSDSGGNVIAVISLCKLSNMKLLTATILPLSSKAFVLGWLLNQLWIRFDDCCAVTADCLSSGGAVTQPAIANSTDDDAKVSAGGLR